MRSSPARYVRPSLILGLALALAPSLVRAPAAAGRDDVGKGEWISLFNGKDLEGWTPKITGYAAGENYADTFRVEDGVIKVSYAKYPKIRRQVRAPLLQAEILQVSAPCRISVRGRPVSRRSGMGAPQQRRDDPQPADRDDAAGPGVPGLDRGPVPRRRRQEGAGDRRTPARRAPTSSWTASSSRRTRSTRGRRPMTETGGSPSRSRSTAASLIKHIVEGETVLEVREAPVRRPRCRRPEADPGRGRDARRRLPRPPGREPPRRVPQDRDPPARSLIPRLRAGPARAWPRIRGGRAAIPRRGSGR